MKKRNDLLLIGALLLTAALLWVLVRPSGTGGWAVVMQNGTELARYPLDTDRTVTLGEGAYNIFQIAGGKAAVIDANCGDHTCVRTGAVSREGESIICLPHRLVIRIEGGRTSGFDAGTG